MTRARVVSRMAWAAVLLLTVWLGGCDAVPLPNSPGRGVPRQDGPLSVPPSELKTTPAPP